MREIPEKSAREVFGRHAAYYVTSPAHTDPASLTRLLEFAMPQPHWRALDIGTGTGHTALALSPRVRHVVGLDPTPEMLAHGRALQAEHEIPNLSLIAGDVHDLPFNEETFDLVVTRRAAHHFTDIQQALDEMNAVLKLGGRLVIDDRSVPDSDFADTCMNKLDRYHDPSHVRQYRAGEWEAMLRANGFHVEVVERYERHRPLTSLTDTATVDDQYKIYMTLDRLNAYQRSVLKLIEVEGVPYINHWYVLIAATRTR